MTVDFDKNIKKESNTYLPDSYRDKDSHCFPTNQPL